MVKCLICKTGDIEPGTTTFTAEREGRAFVFRNVPARVCEQCGEPYFDAAVVRRLEQQIDQAMASGAEVAMLSYRAA
jgi:YgiT-type zinc finger domain-containing protein